MASLNDISKIKYRCKENKKSKMKVAILSGICLMSVVLLVSATEMYGAGAGAGYGGYGYQMAMPYYGGGGYGGGGGGGGGFGGGSGGFGGIFGMLIFYID
ncbi:hypothetical protein MAR_037420 [Mya arenaria]|uniref:Glycine-rich protein n=1 Tax=Mya arenaria TaxID=6604 RepID=A0ABY7FSQ2_MYAAR|nr:hypothetical protein MAR_037420 [Mya arenaria]